MAVSQARLNELIARFETVEARLAVTSDGEEIVNLSLEHTQLSPVAKKARALMEGRQHLEEAATLVGNEDTELATLARSEQFTLKTKLEVLEQEMQILLLPKDRDDEADVVLEIRAGTGGDEASLFAGDLFRMYQRYASARDWKTDLSSVSPGESGGYKEIILQVSGSGVYGRWKYESGVHRVQRVPQTESGDRIHTSAATVAVLPSPQEIKTQIRPEDLRVETFRASGAGGQHVNKTDSAVRVTHVPTGIKAVSSEKSQHYNRARAMEILQARFYERERLARASERAQTRRTQIGSGDRSQRIRTYNFPEKRVSDHRIGLTLHKLEGILAGEVLDEIIEALAAEEQSRLLLETQGQEN